MIIGFNADQNNFEQDKAKFEAFVKDVRILKTGSLSGLLRITLSDWPSGGRFSSECRNAQLLGSTKD